MEDAMAHRLAVALAAAAFGVVPLSAASAECPGHGPKTVHQSAPATAQQSAPPQSTPATVTVAQTAPAPAPATDQQPQ